MSRAIALIIAALFALSACSSAPAPSPKAATGTPAARAAAKPSTSSKPKVDLAHLRAKDVFGDVTTADACTLTSTAEVPASLRKHGKPPIRAGYETDTCELDVTLAPHHTAYVLFGSLVSTETAQENGATGPGENAGGGLTVVRGNSGSTYCYHYLRFTDGISMTVEADTQDHATTTELCTAGHDLTLAIAAHLRAGKGVGHAILRESSVRHRNACDFLSLAQVRSTPHLSAMVPFGSFPAHQACVFSNDTGGSVELDFVRVTANLSSFAEDGKPTIAGRPTARRHKAVAAGTQCELVMAITKGSPSRYADESVDGISLKVRRSGSVEPVCADVTALAKKIWPKLPTA